RGVPRALGAALVLSGIVLVGVAVLIMVVGGVTVRQTPWPAGSPTRGTPSSGGWTISASTRTPRRRPAAARPPDGRARAPVAARLFPGGDAGGRLQRGGRR